MRGGVLGRWRAALGVALVAAFCVLPAAAAAKSAKKKASGGNPCADSDDEPDFPWQRFKAGNVCVEFTNTLTGVYQHVMSTSGVPPAAARRGVASTDNPDVITFTYKPSLATTTPMALGDFKTTFELSTQYASDDGNQVTTLSEGTAQLAGATVGYTDSVMNFWDGDFQFSAAVPARTVGVVRYEYGIFKNSKLGLSLESGVPTSSTSSTEFAPIYTDDPVLAGRWLYETDPLTLDLAGMVHRLHYGGDNGSIIPALANRSGSVLGWAITAGVTVALPALGDDDKVSGQVTYAANASPYLGTNSDLSTLASVIPFKVDTRGFSAVASYHRAWTDEWETNVFVSYLALDIDLPAASPAVRTVRLAANVQWSPLDYVTVGAELGYLHVRADPNGTVGVVSNVSGEQLTGYLFAELDF
ncbi:MAG: porin [Pseudolabrys sp.]